MVGLVAQLAALIVLGGAAPFGASDLKAML